MVRMPWKVLNFLNHEVKEQQERVAPLYNTEELNASIDQEPAIVPLLTAVQ